MSNPGLDALAESARNRGLKLVRSRVRTPGKRLFGKVGLTDASGRALFGMDAKGPTAKPDEVEDYLRNLGAGDWGASLDAPVAKRKARPRPQPAEGFDPAPNARNKIARKSEAPPKPVPKIRNARPSDAPRLAELIRLLGHDIDEPAVRRNVTTLHKAGEPALVATLDKEVVGLCAVHRTVALHRDAPLGRITILVVAEDARGQGIGRLLVEAAEAWMRSIGCKLVEVTSNDRLAEAHAFYRHMGYDRTSIRFARTL